MPSALAPMSFPRKDPDETITYGLDWSEWLNEGDTIQSAVITVTSTSDTPVIKFGESINDGVTTEVVLKDGAIGEVATIHFRVTTTPGLLIGERTVSLEIAAK